MVEYIWTIIELLIRFAIILFPTVYLLDAIRKRIQPETRGKEMAVIFFMSLLITLAFYPFLAGLLEYTIALEYNVDVDLLLLDSDMATYFIILISIFLIYLIVYNKTKE